MQILKNIFIAVLFTVLISGCSKALIGTTKWSSAKIIVDGKPDDWELPLKYYDRESAVSYDVANDNQNIYIIIRATENASQVKIVREGMRLAIDVAGLNNFPVEIFYPLPGVMTLDEHQEQQNKVDDLSESINFRKNFLLAQNQMRLIGFNSAVPNGLTNVNNPYGISAAINWDKEGILYYEAVIPFSTFYKQTISANDTIKPWSFRIIIDGLVQSASGGHLRDADLQSKNGTNGNSLLSNTEVMSGAAHVGYDRNAPANNDGSQNNASTDPMQSESQLFVANRIIFKLKLNFK